MAQQQTQDLIEEFCHVEEHVENLIYIRDVDQFLYYDEECGYYKRLSKDAMEEKIYYFIKSSKKNYTRSLITDVQQGVKYEVIKKQPTLKKNYIALKDAMINLEELSVEAHDKRNVAYHYIDCSRTDLDMDTPVWDTYIRDVLVTMEGETDDELVQVVEEVMGFYLLEEMKPEAVFFLYGQGANGKSKFLNLLEAMLGSEYTKYRSLESLTGNQFAAVDLLGNKLNIIRDDESKYIRADKLKTIVTGEAITADRKFKDSIDFVPQSKIICSMNRIPTFTGLDYGLKRRVNFIPFNRQFSDDEMDHDLDNKLLKELPGILWKVAVKGARRLRENNYVFSKSLQMEQMMHQFEADVSSAIEFVREVFINDINGFVSNKELYAQYEVWCRQNGRKHMSSKKFFNDINPICESTTQWVAEHTTSMRGRKLTPIMPLPF